MTTEQRKNCSTLNDLCNTVKSLDDRLVSEHTDRVNTELQLQSDFDSKVTQNTNQLRSEFSQEIEAVNNNIKTEVNKAIASVVDEAPESFDTLKEAADWIQAHGTEAAAMQSAITNLENNLTQEALDRTAQLNSKVDKDLSNATGALPISNGGTGATTANGARNNLLSNVSVETSTPDDDSLFVMNYTSPSDTNGAVYTRKASLIWEYIKGKISSVLGLTKTTYNGTATKANELVNLQHITYIKSDNSGYPCYFLTHDISDFFDLTKYNSTTGSMSTRGFAGFIISYRENSGYNSKDMSQGQLFYTATYRPTANSLSLNFNNAIYVPYVLKNKTTNTYYLAVKVSGGGRGISFFGRCSSGTTSKGVSSYVGTEIKCTNGSGALPTDYELVTSFTNDAGTVLDLNPSWYDFSKVDGRLTTYATKSVATTTQNGLMSSSDKAKLDTLVPVGTIFGGVYSTAPTGYLLCNGSTFNKDTYPALYSVLGTNVLPDLRGKFLQGANGNLKQSIEAGLPNVTGSIGIIGGSNDQFLTDNTLANISVDGALYITGTASKKSMANGESSYTTPTGFGFDASKSNSVYGKSTTVQPPAYTVNYIIKY